MFLVYYKDLIQESYLFRELDYVGCFYIGMFLIHYKELV